MWRGDAVVAKGVWGGVVSNHVQRAGAVVAEVCVKGGAVLCAEEDCNGVSDVGEMGNSGRRGVCL